jgi:hypothetical protein
MKALFIAFLSDPDTQDTQYHYHDVRITWGTAMARRMVAECLAKACDEAV